MNREVKQRDLQNDRANIDRSEVRLCCEYISNTRQLFGYNFQRHLDQCFHYSRTFGRAERFRLSHSDRQSNRLSTSRSVRLLLIN